MSWAYQMVLIGLQILLLCMYKKSSIMEDNSKIKYRLYNEAMVRIGESWITFLIYNAKW
jgi:hypothetical protein